MKGFITTLLVVASLSLSACLPAKIPAEKLLTRGKKLVLIYSAFFSFVPYIYLFEIQFG